MNQALKSKPVDSIYQTGADNQTFVTELVLVHKPASEPKMTMAALNEKLTYFYNNGGPIMEEKDGVMAKHSIPRSNRKINQVRPHSGQDMVRLLTPEGTKTVSIDYLNEKLTYFYNHGGPVMDI